MMMKKLIWVSMPMLVMLILLMMVACSGNDGESVNENGQTTLVDGVNVNKRKMLTLDINYSSYSVASYQMTYDSKGRLVRIDFKDNTSSEKKCGLRIDYDLCLMEYIDAVYKPRYAKCRFALNERGFISQIANYVCTYNPEGYLTGVKTLDDWWTFAYDNGDVAKAMIENFQSDNIDLYYVYYADKANEGEMYITCKELKVSDMFDRFHRSVMIMIAYHAGLFGNISKRYTMLPSTTDAKTFVELADLYYSNTKEEMILACKFTFSDDATGQPINGQNIETPESHGSGTLIDPYNVQTALNYISTLGVDTPSGKDIYIKGYITSITELYGSTYDNATYSISDTNDGSNSLLVNCAKYLGNTKYTVGNTDIKRGDEVIICGKVMNYKGTTPETVANQAYLYSLNGQISAAVGINALDGTWTGHINTYYADRWGLNGDSFRTSLYFEHETSYGGWGYELDYDYYHPYEDYYYCEFTWEVYNGTIRLRYADSWNDVYIRNYVLSGNHLDGHMDDGVSSDISFQLTYDNRFDWSHWHTRGATRRASGDSSVQASGQFSK